MKKLILILILSFFSTLVYSGVSYPAPTDKSSKPKKDEPYVAPAAVLCPDGSEPVKSVSEDGYYFIFNCGSVPEVPIVSPKAEVSSETTSDLGEDNYIAKIKEAKALLDSGIISEEQFEKMKQKIIDNI